VAEETENKRESDFIIRVKAIMSGQPSMSAADSLTIIDGGWLRIQGIEPENDEEADNLSRRVYRRIAKQFYNLVHGQLTPEKAEDYWRMMDVMNSETVEIAWLKLNYPEFGELVKRVEDAVAFEIQSAKYKKQLVSHWTKDEIIEQPDFSGYINKKQLQDWGVEATDEEWDALVQNVSNQFAKRTGEMLTPVMTDEQLDEFDKLTENGDDAPQQAYIQQTIPYYKAVIAIAGARLGTEIVNAEDKVALIQSWKQQ
jgi:hypothetical protein